MSAVTTTAQATKPVIRGLEFVAPLIDLGIRLWVANVFWKSGLTKIASWENTVLLFTHEYQVPVLSPEVAAALATASELVFPVLLAIGLASRASAGALFVLNAVAVISYPDLNDVGLKDHFVWGLLLLVTLTHGPGRLSLDYFIRKKWMG